MALTEGTNCGFVVTAPTADPGETGVAIANRRRAVKFTSPAGATTVTEMGWWCDNATNEADFDIGVYAHDAADDEPGARLHVSANNAKGTSGGVWKTVTGLSWSISENTTYWLAVQLDVGGVGTDTDRETNASYKHDYFLTGTSLPDPWGTSQYTAGQILAVYAVYTTAAAPTTGMMNTKTGYWGDL